MTKAEVLEVLRLARIGILDRIDKARAAVSEVYADRDRLAAELAEAKRDAERYRWLRNDPPLTLAVRRFPGETERGCYLDGYELDVAIDAAARNKP